MVNAGKVISNCICFGENIVTINYQAPFSLIIIGRTVLAALIAC